MQLTLRFTAAVTLVVVLALGLQATIHVRRVAELQEREIRDDVRILSRTLAHAAATLWRVEGSGAVDAFIQRAAERRDNTTIALTHDTAGDARDDNTPRIERSSINDEWFVTASTPVVVHGAHVATIEVRRRLTLEQAYRSSVWGTQLVISLVAAVASAVLTLLLGAWFIGRPLSELSELAQRVSAEDFSETPIRHGPDEIGRLGKHLQTMRSKLAESREVVRQERRGRTAVLEKLRHADRLSTVGKMASSVAHELGTPLNVVSGRATMISMDDDAGTEVKEHASVIVEQVSRMTTIIRDMLDYSRRGLDQRPLAVRVLLEEAASLIEPVCDDAGIELTVEATEINATLDAGKALQVLTNLLMNATQAMPDGGRITLGATVEQVDDPSDRSASAGRYIKLSVADDGVGIPEDVQKDIFDAFFTTKGAGKGTGLGLSVCHDIVREHDGFMEVQSEVGKGTCFYVYLPEGESHE